MLHIDPAEIRNEEGLLRVWLVGNAAFSGIHYSITEMELRVSVQQWRERWEYDVFL
jgi:hypothetical protein